MNIQNLKDAVRGKLTEIGFEPGSQAEVNRYVDCTLQIIQETLANGESVVLTRFGTFLPSEHQATKRFNPIKKTIINVPAHKTVRFKVSKKFKDQLNDKKAKATRKKINRKAKTC